MSFTHSDLIQVKRVRGKGRGVFARRLIPKGTEIECVPVLTIPFEDAEASALASYCFLWGRETVGLPLGYGALYNHSYDPNASYHDRAPQTKLYRALRDIRPGEEITINYCGDSDNNFDLDFEVL